MEHIGSAAVPGLSAKPIIDVLLGADSLAVIESKIARLQRAGYQYVQKCEQELPMRRFFAKANGNGLPRINLHAVAIGSTFWNEHIAFRDALRSDDSLLARYQSLKIELAARFADDMAQYTAGKGPFIQSVLAIAAGDMR